MKKLTKYLRPYTKLLIIGPAFKLAEAILELLLPYFMSKAIDYGVAAGDKHYIISIGSVMLLTAIVGVCCALICQYSASLVSQGVGTDIRNDLFKHIGTFSNAELDKFGTASLINRLTNDVNQVQLAVAMLIRLVIRAPFLCIGGFVMAFLLDMKLSAIMLIVIPIFILILYLTMKKSIPLYRMVQKKLDQIALVLRENLSGIRVIRAFASIEHEKKRFDTCNEEYASSAVKVGKISALLSPLTGFIMNAAIGAMIWFGGIQVNSGDMTTGEVIAYIGYIGMILAALIVISNLVVIFTKAYACAGRISEIFDTQAVIVNPKRNHVPENQDKIISVTRKQQEDIAVEFKDVSMTYNILPSNLTYEQQEGNNSREARYAVEHISFRAKHGETIGVIGGTGSGKSTIVNLIPRLYDVTEGNILVNGIDVREYVLDELREKIGVVPQKAVLFTGTIADNIKWGKEDASNDEINKACEIAQISDFIKGLPEGYDTRILRGGVNISGGQRQRLTIARALVRKPQILILDDSFSALDLATDAALRKALLQYTKENNSEMTTFIITQRASTIRNADQIIVLNEGCIAGIGKHNELYNSCEEYREICISQEIENTVKME